MLEFPKWITPHETQIDRKVVGDISGGISSPHWLDLHVARDGIVTVLVQNAEEEAKAQENLSKIEDARQESEPAMSDVKTTN